MSRIRRAALRAALVVVAGCGSSIGPFVTDLAWTPRGELVVTKCMVEVSGAGNSTSYDVNECRQNVLPPPARLAGPPSMTPGFQPPSAAAPPPNSSATVHH